MQHVEADYANDHAHDLKYRAGGAQQNNFYAVCRMSVNDSDFNCTMI